MTPVIYSGNVSEQLIVSNRTKQGCDFAYLSFAFYLSVMLITAFKNVKQLLKFEFKTSSVLFNQQPLKVRTKTIVQTVHALLFANEGTPVDHKLEDMQRIVNKFCQASKPSALAIRIIKKHPPIGSHPCRSHCLC